ncbi:MAG: hypothetical protein H7Y43_07795 [Akkermansiaceae bacterium]|nr:hypothetical protein [Verrucomicrobiales bacterium]
MKTLHYLRSLALVIAVTGLMSTQAVQAQEKGAEKLMKLSKAEDLQKVEAGDTIVMSCPKCKDIFVEVVEKSIKPPKSEATGKVAVHLCASCDTKIVNTGTGKSSESKLVHTCKACGSEEVSCCVIKKGHGTTKGMEKKD